jgi:hypothetical protein
MLKYKIDSLDGVDKSLASFYEEKDGGYVLKVEGIDDGAELKRAKDHEKRARQQAEKERDELRAQFQAIEEERDNLLKGSVPKSNIEALEKSYKDKITKIEAQYGEQVGKLSGSINKLLVDNTAEALARELAVDGSAAVLIPHIKARLAAEEREGQYQTIIKDNDGNPSALSVDDFKNEIRNNPAFAPLLVASKATGGGASQSQGGGAVVKQISRSQFDAMNHAQRAEFAKAGGKVSD